MTRVPEDFLNSLTRLSREQIQQAGQRYTPGIDPGAPNLRIESLITAIENVGCGESALARFDSVMKELSEAWERAAHSSRQRQAIQTQLDDARASLPQLIARFRARDAGAGQEWQARLAGIAAALNADLAYWRAEEAALPAAQKSGSNGNGHRDKMVVLGKCLAVVEEEQEYTESAAFKVLTHPKLLITGEWGTGKTHLLCDVTQSRIEHGHPTVLVLAKNFQGQPVQELCARLAPGQKLDQVFDQLQRVATELDQRALVIIDGINEGLRREWRRAVTKLSALVKNRENIGLIISCRTPFERLVMSQEARDTFHEVTHSGFDDQEFDAQAAFFEYYKLPLPEVPLLDREFSRPLTLKLICQSLQNLTGSKLAKGFAGIASGQKGMTYVLESFVNRIGQPIEEQFGLSTKGCWNLLKGADHLPDRNVAGFAPCMAGTLRGYVTPSEADRIIAANYPMLSRAERRRLLESMRTGGLVEEDVVWRATKTGIKSRVVLRLPYQRFSDHLIARHLLKTYLDTTSVKSIQRSFSPGSPLGKIFALGTRTRHEYPEPGWAQALITEFPARVHGRLPSKSQELFFVLPQASQSLTAYFGPFIDGLFWRDPAAFTAGTRTMINRYLSASDRAWDRTVDALAAIATKPKHPYHAQRLYRFVARGRMPDRDLNWTEYLRRKYASPTIHRLLTWASKLDATQMTEKMAEEIVVLLSLVLPTVVRNDRDVATKALVLIGERFPAVLFAHTIRSLGFDDPYLPERLLAASYGATLSLADDNSATEFGPLLGEFASALYKKMFRPKARYATHHVLRRDYALGIIEVAQSANLVKLPKTAARNLEAPFPQVPSVFVSDGTPDAAVNAAIGHAIHMDFGNYTLGRLIRNRANYDDKKPEYVRVRSKIERRIYDLGYREENFSGIDQQIAHGSFRAGSESKTDRYGKKYSWIAYFEMYGEREAQRKLPEWRMGERSSDCGVDPSFPTRPPTWVPPIPDLFGDKAVDPESWVGDGFTPSWSPLLVTPAINGIPGDWVLLDGFVRGVSDQTNRELFAFLRGAMVSRSEVRRLRRRFFAVDYPGNNIIPDCATEHYLFAGEAGRRRNYAHHLLQRNGRYRRQIVEAFDRYVPKRGAAGETKKTIKFDVVNGAGDRVDDFVFEFASTPAMRHIPGIKMELPTIHFGWESYHSAQNDFSSFYLPAPSLIQRLGLKRRGRNIDFYDAEGLPATLYREQGDGWSGNRHSLLYIRADILRRYLSETRQVMIWCNWGERDWLRKMEGLTMIDNPARQRIYQAGEHLHRSFSQWPATP